MKRRPNRLQKILKGSKLSLEEFRYKAKELEIKVQEELKRGSNQVTHIDKEDE